MWVIMSGATDMLHTRVNQQYTPFCIYIDIKALPGLLKMSIVSPKELERTHGYSAAFIQYPRGSLRTISFILYTLESCVSRFVKHCPVQ